jgi:maltose O-acetyltransferase
VKSQKERMLAGELYVANDAELSRENHRAKRLVREFNQTTEEQPEERQRLLTAMFHKIGAGGYIEPPFHTDYGTNTTIGQHFYANYDAIFVDVNRITIGDNVFMGPRVGLYTAGHPIDAAIRAEELEYGWPITIGNDVWIGGNVVINPGVTIGSNVVIGSGSVVTQDIPDNVVAVGNPCHVLREITAADHDYWAKQRAAYFADRDDEN